MQVQQRKKIPLQTLLSFSCEKWTKKISASFTDGQTGINWDETCFSFASALNNYEDMQIFYFSKPMYRQNSDFINIDTDIIKLVEHQHQTWVTKICSLQLT